MRRWKLYITGQRTYRCDPQLIADMCRLLHASGEEEPADYAIGLVCEEICLQFLCNEEQNPLCGYSLVVSRIDMQVGDPVIRIVINNNLVVLWQQSLTAKAVREGIRPFLLKALGLPKKEVFTAYRVVETIVEDGIFNQSGGPALVTLTFSRRLTSQECVGLARPGGPIFDFLLQWKFVDSKGEELRPFGCIPIDEYIKAGRHTIVFHINVDFRLN